jgi:hypothetical protein
MESFLRRLKYYGIGFGLGLVFVFFFFKNRGCSWLPENRVKNTVLERLIVLNDKEFQTLHEKGLSEKDILDVLNTGDVMFNESIKNTNPKVYVMQKEFKGKNMKFYFTLPNDSFVSELFISKSSPKKIKNSTEGEGTVLHFPNEKDLIFVDSNKLVTCQQDKLGYINTRLILKDMKKGLKVDFAASNFKIKPRPIQKLIWRHPKFKVIEAEGFWYKNKINISLFETQDTLKCDN